MDTEREERGCVCVRNLRQSSSQTTLRKEKKKRRTKKKRTIDNIDHSILLYTRHELPDSQENDTLAAEDMFYFKFIQRIM